MKTMQSAIAFAMCCPLLLAGCGQATKPAAKSSEEAAPAKLDKFAEALAELSPEDRKLAKGQKFCAVQNESPLGGMGPPVKLMVEGQVVFLCCKGCEKSALKNPAETLAKVEKLKQANK